MINLSYLINKQNQRTPARSASTLRRSTSPPPKWRGQTILYLQEVSNDVSIQSSFLHTESTPDIWWRVLARYCGHEGSGRPARMNETALPWLTAVYCGVVFHSWGDLVRRRYHGLAASNRPRYLWADFSFWRHKFLEQFSSQDRQYDFFVFDLCFLLCVFYRGIQLSAGFPSTCASFTCRSMMWQQKLSRPITRTVP